MVLQLAPEYLQEAWPGPCPVAVLLHAPSTASSARSGTSFNTGLQ